MTLYRTGAPQEEKKEAENLGDKDELWMHKWELDNLQTVQSEAFYRMIGRTGITYGDTFRMVKRVSIDHDSAMMRCARPALAQLGLVPLSLACMRGTVTFVG